MDIGPMFAVDLKDKIEERGWTQDEFAARFPFNPEHIGKVIRGARPISFWFAAECAREFKSITVRTRDGNLFTLSHGDGEPGSGKPHDDIPNTEEHENLNGVEHFVNAYNQIEAGRAELRAALADPRTWRYDAEEGRAGRISVVKKLIDIREAADGALQEIHTDDFEVYQEGARLHLAERGLLKEGDDVEPAA